jgi:predicted PurR-regulated permease PerM
MANHETPQGPIGVERRDSALPREPDRLAERIATLQGKRLFAAVALLFLFALFFRFFEAISQVFLIGFVGVIVAMALHAIVVRVPLRRGLATALVALGIVALIGVTIWQGMRFLLPQIQGLANDLPAIQERFEGWQLWLQEQIGMELDLVGAPVEMLLENPLGNAMNLIAGVFGVLELVALTVLVLAGALFIVAKPNDQLLNPILRAVPRERQPAVRRMFFRTSERLVGWLRGTLLSMLIIGAVSGIAFWLLGAPYPILLGVFVGLIEVIPVVGPWIGGAVAVLTTLLYDPQTALYVAIAVLAIQQLEGNAVRPFVMSGAAELHPFVTLMALLLFGTMFGFLGALLALPLTLAIATVVEVFWVEEKLGNHEHEIEPLVETD